MYGTDMDFVNSESYSEIIGNYRDFAKILKKFLTNLRVDIIYFIFLFFLVFYKNFATNL